MLGKRFLHLSGKERVTVQPLFKKVKNNFTYEFWVKPEVPHKIDQESTIGTSGTKGQTYVIAPGHGGDESKSAAGVSVGTNGISVYEHSSHYLPATLVYRTPIKDWTHIAVVYKKKTPHLYINGKFIKSGRSSPKKKVYASGIFGGLDPFGYFSGCIDDLRIWDHDRTEKQIRKNMRKELSGNESGLYGYWKFNEQNQIIEYDSTPNNNHGLINCLLITDKVPKPAPFLSRETIIVVFAGSSYNATRQFAFDLGKAFEKLGYRIKYIDLLIPADHVKLKQLISEEDVLFILGMNGHGIEILDEYIYTNKLDNLFFCYLVDHPMYHSRRINLNKDSQNLIVSCVDQTHLDFLNQYYKGKYSKVFIPHGSSISSPEKFKAKSIKERSIDILFAGSYTDIDECRKKWLDDPDYKIILDEIMETSLYQHTVPTITIAQEAFQRRGIEFSYSDNKRLRNLLVYVDYYIRGRRRIEVLQSLMKLPLRLYNEAWRLVFKGDMIKIHPSIDYLRFQEKMKNSKIVLNVLPNLINGGHDRVFTSMLAGAVSLSDRNIFLESHFKHEESILLYSMNERNLSDKVEGYLRDEERLESIAMKGKDIASKEHTWIARAKQIIKAINNHKSRFMKN